MDKQQIIAALRDQHAQSVAVCSTVATAEFIAPRGSSWSYADHLRHLTKTMRAITRGLKQPWWKLWLAFGRSRQPSRTYEQVRNDYLTRLPTAFSGRPNPFAPSPRDANEEAEAWRAQVMQYYDVAFQDIIGAIEKWNEGALDKFRLPHPLLGKLTVREMLLFNLYHNQHHLERLPQDTRPSTSARADA